MGWQFQGDVQICIGSGQSIAGHPAKPDFKADSLEGAQSGKGLVVKTKKTYSAAFKRQVVEELLSGSATAGQLSRRYEISAGLIGHWRNRYREGKLVEGKTANVKTLEAKIKDLEQMVGRLTMDNDLLKKAMEYTLQKKRENSLPITGRTLEGSNGGAKC